MSNATLENGPVCAGDAEIKMAVFKQAAMISVAMMECSETLRNEVVQLFKQIADPNTDDDERYATAMLISEILFPDSDPYGWPGLDLEEAESFAKAQSREAVAQLKQMDDQEQSFSDRLRTLMSEKKVTQEELANKIGVGQSAISMMLQRACRPQKRTVAKLAEALGVTPVDLWPC